MKFNMKRFLAVLPFGITLAFLLLGLGLHPILVVLAILGGDIAHFLWWDFLGVDFE